MQCNSEVMVNKSVIKVEAEDIPVLYEDVDNFASNVSYSKISSSELSSNSFNQNESSNFNKKLILASQSYNVYDRSRRHFTGMGIVTTKHSRLNFPLKSKKNINKKLKENNIEKKEGISASNPKEEIVVGLNSPESMPTDLIKFEVDIDNSADSESYYHITKKRCRKLPGLLYNDPNITNLDDFRDVKSESEERNEIEINVNEGKISNETNKDAPSNWLINKKIFKRIGLFSDAVVECTICFKQMKDSSMKQHLKTHSGAKPYICHCCGARFTRKGDVCRHRRSIHVNNKPFECCVCGKRFVDRKSLISHLQNHERTFYYMCSICGFKFGKKEYFENHIKFIHPLSNSQNVIAVKDIIKKGVKQLQELLDEEKEELKLGKNCTSSKEPISDEASKDLAFIKQEDDTSSSEEYNDRNESVIENCKEEISRDEEEMDIDNFSVEKGTLSLTQEMASQVFLAQEEELVDRAISAAISQSQNALEAIQSSLGGNMSSNVTKKVLHSSSKPKLRKIKPKSSEIHINAIVGDNPRKFIIQIPSGSNIDATTQEGMDMLVNMVNYLCSGKGELNGPVEVAMHHTL